MAVIRRGEGVFEESVEICSSFCEELGKMGLPGSVKVPFVVGDYGFIDLLTCTVVTGLVVRWRQVKRRW